MQDEAGGAKQTGTQRAIWFTKHGITTAVLSHSEVVEILHSGTRST